LGGEILSDNLGRLGYAYQLLDPKYHTLNWYIEKMENENQNAYCKRSYEKAKDSIFEAFDVAKKLGKECYIVLVV